ncbi:MAG TPA: hypothetical protein VFQ39_02550, partial [Longimicrobium sp.]|nr:hypothetical protein [Longimicrobium sp.]
MFLRRLLLLALFALTARTASAQEPELDRFAVNGAWKFARGDSAAWSAPALDDRAWATVEVPGEW